MNDGLHEVCQHTGARRSRPRCTTLPGDGGRLRVGFMRRRWHAAVVMVLLATAAISAVRAQAGDGWQMIGRLGLMQLVVVDSDRVADEALYDDAIATLCQPGVTCFVRFYSNPEGVTPSVPLPDAISHNATAFYSLSAKQRARMFQWSCRIRNDPGRCF